MKKWFRTGAVEPHLCAGEEHWKLLDDDDEIHSFSVLAQYHKPFNVQSVKSATLAENRNYALFLRKAAQDLYSPQSQFHLIENCPCCAFPTTQSALYATIYGIEYRACAQCGHAYVAKQPSQEDLNRVFQDSSEHSSAYTDEAALRARLSEIVEPKYEWITQAYTHTFGLPPQRILDVGAGGGHFVHVCRRHGCVADGFELSQSSRAFAKSQFDIELLESNFLDMQALEHYDMVTFFGLLEYTPDPQAFIKKAREFLHPTRGMLIVEVPRSSSLSSAIQTSLPDTVARHLDPTSHVNCFSDSSLFFALTNNGFQPRHAWYFGMDVFELLTQLAITRDDEALLSTCAPVISSLQKACDMQRLCDDIIVAAICQ